MPTATTKRFHLQTLELSSFFLCPVSLPPYRPKPSPFASIPLGYENLNGFSLIFVYAHAPPPPNFTPCSCLRPVTLYPATVVSRTRAARFGISRRTAPPSCLDTHSHIHSQSVSQCQPHALSRYLPIREGTTRDWNRLIILTKTLIQYLYT